MTYTSFMMERMDSFATGAGRNRLEMIPGHTGPSGPVGHGTLHLDTESHSVVVVMRTCCGRASLAG